VLFTFCVLEARMTGYVRLFRSCVAAALVLTTGALAGGPASPAGPAGALPPPAYAVPLAQCDPDPDTPKRQMRAMWIASVNNLDWPSTTGLSVAVQRAELRQWFDLAQAHRMNAVVVQVRPNADAFWPSPYEPWSRWLTGTQGADPGYDPLAFMVDEAHARNLELHAWFNPYRIGAESQLHPDHPALQHPDWVFSYGGQLVYDPGVPAVRDHVTSAVMHAVDNYDIDAVHFDDYFYPYPSGGTPIPDQDTFAQYGGGFSTIEDWRRNNVDTLVQQLGQQIHAAKPWVKFGISPFGIWRNQSTDPRGSATSGLQSYDAIFADSRRWVRQEWVDYIAPQIYWHLGFQVADYAELVSWWSGVVSGTHVQLLVGQAAYKAGSDPGWQDPAELTDHLYFNRNHPEVAGDIYFRAGHVAADPLGAVSRLTADHYSRPALVPVAGQPGGSAPPAPAITSAGRVAGGVAVSWQPDGSSSPTSYAVYRVDGSGATDPCAFEDAGNLIATVRGTAYLDAAAAAGATYTYHVTALDRHHRESSPSAGAVVAGGGGGGYQAIVDTTMAGSFTASGNWGTSSFSPQRYGETYRFAEPVAASDPAWFRFELPATAGYLVEVWYPSDPGYHSATPYLVQTTAGLVSVRVDQRTGGGQWVALGTFNLAAGGHDVVGVSRWAGAGGYVIADAVRISSVPPS
jgi:uncharacterized lipoprotein YddW (UPF0748 family)